MIDAIDEMCRTWGAQKHHILTSREQGWTPQSVIARFRELRDGAGSSTERLMQFPEEGHIGEGLMVARAMMDAPEILRRIVFAHYVIRRVKAGVKATALGISLAEYWRDVDRAHYWIAARVDGPRGTIVETKKSVNRLNECALR
jgi:hypothetical protein